MESRHEAMTTSHEKKSQGRAELLSGHSTALKINFFRFFLDDCDASMTSRWQKFRLLMWKNYLLQWRHPFQTILEIAIPVLFSALLVLIRSLVTPDMFPGEASPLVKPAIKG